MTNRAALERLAAGLELAAQAARELADAPVEEDRPSRARRRRVPDLTPPVEEVSDTARAKARAILQRRGVRLVKA